MWIYVLFTFTCTFNTLSTICIPESMKHDLHEWDVYFVIQKLHCEKKTFELRFCVIIIVNKLRSYCKKNIVIGSIAPSLQMVFLRVYPTLWAFHRLKQLLESPQAFDFNNNVNGRSSENYATYWKTSEHHHLLHILHLTAKERQNVLFPHIFDITSNRLQAEQRWNPQSLH